jgi:amino acid adenylation domain-containing protein
VSELEYAVGSSTIPERFADQVSRTPNAVAVSSPHGTLTYRELDERANQVAHRLIGLGVGADDPIGVLMRRSSDVVVTILGILKAGACYLPIHDSHPADRVQLILERSSAPVLIVDAELAEAGLPTVDSKVLVPEQDDELTTQPVTDPGVALQPDQLAYVISTSGSTGNPKGVMVAHRDAVALATDTIWESGHHDRVLMIAPYAFNVSTYELWVPLLRGGTIVVSPPSELDVAELAKMIEDGGITGIHLTAGLFRVLAEEAPEALAGVREVLTGGDMISPAAVTRVLAACPDIVIRAMYGATEGTLFSTTGPMTESSFQPGPVVPVGGPLDEVELYVLDDRLEQVPDGVDGELYIGGPGLARGYVGQPDLTAERFVADPFAGGGARMYRTGDMMRKNDDGHLEFIGRSGDQVKILGFRVELAEVEAAVARYPGLAHAAVVARESESGDKRLIAYVVAESDPVEGPAVRRHVADSLPEYMVPAAVVVVDALPLTPNGKLDRRALPEPDFESLTSYREPQNPLQESLCAVFAEVLGVEKVGIDDSFFDLGGQSLLAMRLISRLRSELRIDLPISVLFDAPTVISLAEQAEKKAAA